MSAALKTEILTLSRFTITVHVIVLQHLSSSSVTPLLQQCCPMGTSLEATVLKQTCFWCNLKISFEFNYVLDDSTICLLWAPFAYAQNWSVIVFAGLCPVIECPRVMRARRWWGYEPYPHHVVLKCTLKLKYLISQTSQNVTIRIFSPMIVT